MRFRCVCGVDDEAAVGGVRRDVRVGRARGEVC